METLAHKYAFALALLQGDSYLNTAAETDTVVSVEQWQDKWDTCLVSLREEISILSAPAIDQALSVIENAMNNLHEGELPGALVLFTQIERQISRSISQNFEAQLVATRIQLLCLFHRLDYFAPHCDTSLVGDTVQKVFSELISLPSFKNALVDATTTAGKFKPTKPSKLSDRTQQMLCIMTKVLNLRTFLTSVTYRTYDILTRDGVLDVWRDLKLVPVVPVNMDNMVRVLCMLLAEDKLYVSDERSIITVFDTQCMNTLHTIQCTHQAEHILASDNRLYTTNATNKVITIYDTLTYTLLTTIVCKTPQMCDILVTNNRIFVSGGSRQGVIYVWDKTTCAPLPSLEGGVDYVYGLYESGGVLYSGWDSKVVVYDISNDTYNSGSSGDSNVSGVLIGQMNCSPQGRVHQVTCITKCDHMLFASRGMYIDVFDVSSISTINNTTATTTPAIYPLLQTLSGHATIITSLHIQHHTLYSSSLDSTVKVWDLNTTALSNTNTITFGHTFGINSVVAQGCRVYSASYDVVIAFVE